MKRQLERVEMLHRGRQEDRRPRHWRQSPGAISTRAISSSRPCSSNVDNKSRIAQEEIFGPVLCDHPGRGRGGRHPRRQRQSNYGLSGAVLTNDPQAAYDVARRIRTGGIAQNGLKVD